MAIFSSTYVVYERLASAKLNSMVASINSHTHDGSSGIQINFLNLAGSIALGQIPAGLITSGKIGTGEVKLTNLENSMITIGKINLSSIHLSSDGYAVYAP